MPRQTIADLQEELKVRQETIDSLQSQLHAERKHKKNTREKIDQLKFVARHYRRERDTIDAYLSAIIDQINDPVEERKPEIPEYRDFKAPSIVVHNPKYQNRPRPSTPLGSYRDDRFPINDDDRNIFWEEF
jgi:hypothetical protein